MFSSKPLAERNNDPEPYMDQWGIDRTPDGNPAGYDFDVRFTLQPRPEFQQGHLPANEFLIAFRQRVNIFPEKSTLIAQQWVDNLAQLLVDTEPGSAAAHAYRVITLWLAVQK